MSTSAFVPPKAYKAAAVRAAGQPLEFIEVEWKDPEPGNIVIKVLACGVCHTDVVTHDQVFPTLLPRIPGHEVVGDVVAVHPSEKLWKVGDRVGAGWHGGHCGTCNPCRQGKVILCDNLVVNGLGTDGGYAEYMTAPSNAIARIPKDIDPAEAAPLLCAGVTMYNSIRNMDVKPGDVVAVQGIGGLGHLGLQFCRAMGYHTVAISTSGSKRAVAAELGAHEYIDASEVSVPEALQKLGGAKVIASTAPSPETLSNLVHGLQADGTLLILGVIPEFNVPILPMINKRLSVRAWPGGSAKDSEEAAQFAKISGVKTRVERYSLEKANEAYERMTSGKASFRAVIVPN